jgi:hypothetical protein
MRIIPIPARVVIPQKRRKTSTAVAAHLGTARLGARAIGTFSAEPMSRTLLFYTSPIAWMNGGKRKGLSSSSFVLSAETIDLDETEHGSMEKLERGTISPAAPYNCQRVSGPRMGTKHSEQ